MLFLIRDSYFARFFIIAIIAAFIIGFQKYLFAATAAELSLKIRQMGFKSMLRQDIKFFDREENSVSGFPKHTVLIQSYVQAGILTSKLSQNAEQVNGLAGLTLAT